MWLYRKGGDSGSIECGYIERGGQWLHRVWLYRKGGDSGSIECGYIERGGTVAQTKPGALA